MSKTLGEETARYGLKAVRVIEMTKTSRQTLSNWQKDKRLLFTVVLVGCAAIEMFGARWFRDNKKKVSKDD